MGKIFATPPVNNFHKQKCCIVKEQLEWYGETPDEGYWYEYWKPQLQGNYYEQIEKLEHSLKPEGKFLLPTLSKTGKHIEAGCGTGYWVHALKLYGFDIEGIEYSERLVDLVKKIRPSIHIEVGNALAINKPDEYYNSYISLGVVEHRIEGPDLFLLEAHRVLVPGGKIIISVPFFGPLRRLKAKIGLYDKERPIATFYQYGFTKNKFSDLLRKAGFEVESVHLIGGVHRLFQEELAFYRWLSYQRGGYRLEKLVEKVFQSIDSHMVLFVGQKL